MLSVLIGAVLISSNVVWAEEVLIENSNGNKLVFDNDYISYDREIYGGYSNTGTANENKITIEGGTFERKIYGGYSSYSASDNLITINGGTIKDRIYGGYSSTGNADSNIVIINGGTIEKEIYGAYSNDSGIGIGNKVIINNGTFAPVYGSRAYASIGNEVIINNGIFNNAVYGGTSTRNVANENKVIISNGTFKGSVYGGKTTIGDANENEVIISGGTFKGTVYGGYGAGNGNVNKNEVIISGGTFEGNIYGGYAGSNNKFSGTVDKNSVTINGGTFSGGIYGGFVEYDDIVSNNIVNISGVNTDVSNADLYGGYVTGENGSISTGNILNIGTEWNGKVKSIQDFDAINFQEVNWQTDSSVITVSDKLALNETDGTVVTVDTVRVSGAYEPKTEMTLISASDIIGELATNSSAKVFKGVATIYDATLEKEGNDIKIKLGDESSAHYNASVMNPQVLVIGESRVAATAFTNQGNELVETGLDALSRDNEKVVDTKVFAALYGNASEYVTGSHVRVNGFSGIVGVGKTNDNGLTVGAFFENGKGNYRTYNSLNGEFMRGDGEANYNGGGLLIRKDNANGVYTEASLRAGNLQNELHNAVQGSEGLTGYDIDTFYYGAHVGIGKVVSRGNDGDSIDVYGKFIYTHHEGENFKLDGDEFHFDSVDSVRLRLGFRINEVQTNKLAMYYGAAWEYEFGGDADNTVVGYDLSTPSLGGSTVIGELGAHYKASEKWSFDLNGRAYVGQREGFSGSVQANFSF